MGCMGVGFSTHASSLTIQQGDGRLWCSAAVGVVGGWMVLVIVRGRVTESRERESTKGGERVCGAREKEHEERQKGWGWLPLGFWLVAWLWARIFSPNLHHIRPHIYPHASYRFVCPHQPKSSQNLKLHSTKNKNITKTYLESVI